MATITDPARELGEIAQRLTKASTTVGEKYLADEFNVIPWSTDFVKIVACILDRADLVERVLWQADLDDDHREKAIEHLAKFKSGFTGTSLRRAWNEGGIVAMRDHGSPIQFLSPTVRAFVKYPRLSMEEVAELLIAVDAYLDTIIESGDGPDFVRQAIIDGLGLFRFQLERIGWMGSGYALTAFREVLFVYEMADKELRNKDNPDAEKFLKGFLGIITNFKAKVDSAKGWHESGKAVFDAYQLTSSIAAPLLLTSHFGALSGS